MKKHIIVIMNIVLIAAIVGALVYSISKALSDKPAEVLLPTESVVEPVAKASSQPETVSGERFKIGIVQHATSKPNDYCYQGFVSQLKSRGLLDNLDIIYVVEDDDEKCVSELKRLIGDGCDLLYAIGPFAAEKAAGLTSELPIVFAAVTDPEEAGLVESNEAPGGNVTGVSSYTPCFEQIDLIPVLLPDADSIASIHNSTDENAVRQAIIASWEAEEFGYTADRYPVSDADGLKDALNKIKEKGTDVIYLPIDKLISEHLDTVTEFSKENGIPIICGNEEMMSKGCLATCKINYTSVGRKSADLACDILYGKKDPAALSVIYKYDCYNLVNKKVLDELGIKLSEIALENVELIDIDTDNG